MLIQHRLLLCLTLCVLLCPALVSGAEPAATGQPKFSELDLTYFEKKIRPLLHKHCYECHSNAAKTLHGSLKLDTYHGTRTGGDSGPAIVAGKPEESLLIESILYSENSYQMPPKGKLAAAEIAELTNWIRRGAPMPFESTDNAHRTGEIDYAVARQFWSFQPVAELPLPATKQTNWPHKRIDHFILSRLEHAGLRPAQPADRRTLIRRVNFDLIGLPPTPEEVEAFIHDERPDAYEQLVERLLASPHYGERWGRHWLDLARYTDTTASWLNSTAQAHLYRDWVVKAFNDDMPYDQFIVRQLATDQLEETGVTDLPALGFIGLSPTYWKELKLPPEIIKVIVADEWEERIDTVSRTFLGLTVACARCHDHKFDPISMEDYYALAGVFASTRLTEKPMIAEPLYEPVRKAKLEIERLRKEIAKLNKMKPKPAEKIKQLQADIRKLKQTPYFDTPMANVIADEALYVEQQGKTFQSGSKIIYKPQPRNLNMFIRGNPNRLGKPVPRRFIKVLSASDPQPFQKGSGRLELARAITEDAAALVARVIINRVWRGHFGRGLVTTPSNFGALGERPSHPELLDDLAARFIEQGWSIKWLHREIMLSATYRQASTYNEAQNKVDPENKWLWRMNRRRLEVEAWRDAMLAVSGKLDPTIGGPAKKLHDPKNNRRTIYTTIHRREMSKMLQIHDFPDPISHSPKRVNTTTALQGLYVLNGPLLSNQSAALAERLGTAFPSDTGKQIEQIYRLLYGREPTANELQLGRAFLADANPKTWKQYAQVLLGSNEFVYID